MMQVQEGSPGAPGAPAASGKNLAPEDRSTTFQPVEGGTETRSGTTLLVEAYAALWLILFAWLLFMWRKQASLHARLDGLERALDRAEKAGAGAANGTSRSA